MRRVPARRRWYRIALAGVVMTPACGGSEVDTVSESLTEYRIDSMPRLQLGVDVDTVSFTDIVLATRRADGGITVIDRGDFARLDFSADGQLAARSLRKGQGPGEMEYPGRAFRCGDSLFLNDIGRNRQLVTSVDGIEARSFAWGRVDDRPPYRSACNADGRFVHYGWGAFDPQRTPYTVSRDTVAFWLSRADSIVGQRLGRFPSSDRFQIEGGSVPLPLGLDTRVAIARHRVYIGTAESWRIDVFDTDGRRLAPLIRDEPRVMISPADIEAALAEELASRPIVWHAQLREEFARTPFDRPLPAYGALLVDADDRLWVQQFPRADSATVRWHVFDTTGSIVAFADLPRALTVLEIGRDYLLARTFDAESGAPTVVMHALRSIAAP